MDTPRSIDSERLRFFHQAASLLLTTLSLVGFAGLQGTGDASASEAATNSANREVEPTNVLLITIDTLRADATGFAGNADAKTPTLNQLATQGRAWTNAHAHSVTTLPSHTSLLTGLYPYQHGVRANGRFVLDPGVPTLATLLRQANFATGAFIGAYPLDSRFGLDQGFDVYDDDYPVRQGDQAFKYSERAAPDVVRRALAWWQTHQERSRFLWLHLFDPHAPYEPPEPFASRFARNPYLGEVAAVDAALAPLLAGFLSGKEEPTLIVMTSDHGEGLGDHGEITHGLFAYEATLKVPLVIWGPGIEAGKDSQPARLIDVLPTICDLMGVELGAEVAGRSLLSPHASDVPSYFEALSANLDYGWAPLRGVISEGKKLIQLPLPEFYDLRLDPGERENLIRSERAGASELAALMPIESAWPPAAGEASSEEVERLRSLGYLTGAEKPRPHYTEQDDPKNLVELDRKMMALSRLYSLGKINEAVAVAREVVAKRPTMTLGQLYLARLLLAQGALEEALQVLEHAHRLGSPSRELLVQLSLVLAQTGRPKEALEILSPLLLAEPETDVLNARASALIGLRRHSEADVVLDQALKLNPRSGQTLELKSNLALEQSRYDDARGFAKQAIAIDNFRADSWNNLGVALYFLGSKEEAIKAWKNVLQLAPQHLDALLSLGVVSAETGRVTEARDLLQRFIATATSARYGASRRQAEEILRQLGAG